MWLDHVTSHMTHWGQWKYASCLWHAVGNHRRQLKVYSCPKFQAAALNIVVDQNFSGVLNLIPVVEVGISELSNSIVCTITDDFIDFVLSCGQTKSSLKFGVWGVSMNLCKLMGVHAIRGMTEHWGRGKQNMFWLSRLIIFASVAWPSWLIQWVIQDPRSNQPMKLEWNHNFFSPAYEVRRVWIQRQWRFEHRWRHRGTPWVGEWLEEETLELKSSEILFIYMYLPFHFSSLLVAL